MEVTTRADELLANVKDLNRLIISGNLLQAFDTYYDEEVVMQENQAPATVGKAANRAREQEWLEKVTEFRKAEVKAVSVDPDRDVTMVEWVFDYTHADWGAVQNHQVSVQRWRGDRIVHERFVYG